MLGGSLRQVRYNCPEGYMWSEDSPGIGKCVEDHGERDDDYPFRHCTLDNLCAVGK